jgi:hypothetical protein
MAARPPHLIYRLYHSQGLQLGFKTIVGIGWINFSCLKFLNDTMPSIIPAATIGRNSGTKRTVVSAL